MNCIRSRDNIEFKIWCITYNFDFRLTHLYKWKFVNFVIQKKSKSGYTQFASMVKWQISNDRIISRFVVQIINLRCQCHSFYRALVLFEQMNCIDWMIFAIYCHWWTYSFSGTHVTCYLLSFGKEVLNTVYFLLTENIKKGNQGVIV